MGSGKGKQRRAKSAKSVRGQDYSDFMADAVESVRAAATGKSSRNHSSLSFHEFLQLRAAHKGGSWVGRSSDELVNSVINAEADVAGRAYPGFANFPNDYADLDRCEQTYRLMPEWERMLALPAIAEYREHVEARHGPRKGPARELNHEVADAFGVAPDLQNYPVSSGYPYGHKEHDKSELAAS